MQAASGLLKPALAALVLALACAACNSGSAGPDRAAVAQAAPTPAELGLTEELPSSLAGACRELARHPRTPPAAQVCPPLVPAGETEVELSAPYSRQRRYRGGWTMSLASCSLETIDGRRVETNGCHWLYQVAWSADVRRLLRAGVAAPPNAERRSRCREVEDAGARMTACRVTSFEKGGGMHAGHVAYVWRHGRALFVLSAHGYENEPRVRAMMAALARAQR